MALAPCSWSLNPSTALFFEKMLDLGVPIYPFPRVPATSRNMQMQQRVKRQCLVAIGVADGYTEFTGGRGETGRRSRFRFCRATVGVQVPPAAPFTDKLNRRFWPEGLVLLPGFARR